MASENSLRAEEETRKLDSVSSDMAPCKHRRNPDPEMAITIKTYVRNRQEEEEVFSIENGYG